MGMPKGLIKANAHYNNLAAWADWRKLAAEVTGADCPELVAQYQPPEKAGWRKIDKASARLRAAFAARPNIGATWAALAYMRSPRNRGPKIHSPLLKGRAISACLHSHETNMKPTQTSIPSVTFMGETLEVVFGRYPAAPQNAIVLFHQQTGEQWCVASVCLPDYQQAPDEVFVKNWSENEGLLDALIAAGIVADTGRTLPTGFVQANVCRLLVPGQPDSQP